MKHCELLRAIADRLERNPPEIESAIVLNHPIGAGKFPFAGGGTERLSQTQDGTNYWVPAHRILSGLAKALKP